GPLGTGDTAAGQAVRRGMEAYFNFVNSNGGLDGRRVELQAADDGGDPTRALGNVQAMVESGNVFAFLGPVGNDSARQIAPYLVDQRRLLLGAVSGSSVLRKTPPDRYVFNVRPGLSDELTNAISYLTANRNPRVPAANIALFAEGLDDQGNLSDFSQEGATLVENELTSRGVPAADIVVTTHTRNTNNVNQAVSNILQWLANDRTPNLDGSVGATVLIVTNTDPATEFIKVLTEELAKIQSGSSSGEAFGLTIEQATSLFTISDLSFFAVSTVGVEQLGVELSSLGTFTTVSGPRTFCDALTASQVVPPSDSNATGIIQYRDHLRELDATLVPSSLGLEGYLIAQLFARAVVDNGPALSTEGVVDALEQLNSVDFGTGTTLQFSQSQHQATDEVFGTELSSTCSFDAVDLGEPVINPPPTGDDCPGGVCTLTGVITENQTLTANFRYLLRGTVFVGDGTNPTTLTVQPGTTILGERATTGTLVVRRGSQLQAVGSVESPIVFTSDRAQGNRAPGDWGGIILNGRAPINRCGLDAEQCATFNQAFGEGGTGFYGGDNPNDNSGELRYVRIEFAGKLLSPENELNGLALQGVGRGTVLDYIQIHRGKDDGIEFFGGTVDFKHVLVTGAQDDSFDWTEGWTGRGQFLVVQQWPDDSDNGIEADNNDQGRDTLPRARPLLTNLTLVGVPTSESSDLGILLREGTGAEIRNSVVFGFNDACFDIDHPETWATTGSTPSGIIIENSIFSCATNFEEEAEDPMTVESFITSTNPGNSVLPTTDSILRSPFNTINPDMRPASGSAAETGAASIPSDAFFEQVTYRGGVAPNSDWTLGWTTYVEN
ncbi:MAG: ABC transporter substrate-binding protein, partial [Myxococcota bacterium]